MRFPLISISMRRGFDHPTSSSSALSDTSTPEHTQRTRQGQNDVTASSNTVQAQRGVSNQATLNLPPQERVQSAPSERRSPAYLEGKNPYGQILEDVDHPYRRPRVTGGAPSQIGATSEGRPRTSGSFNFKTRPEAVADSELEITAQDPPLPPSLPLGASVSVKAAKDFFDSKASQNQLVPPFSYTEAVAVAASTVRKEAVEAQQSRPIRRFYSDRQYQPMRVPNPRPRFATPPDLSIGRSISSLQPESSSHLESRFAVEQYADPRSNIVAPKVTIREVTTLQGVSELDNVSSSDQYASKLARRQSTDVFETASQEASPLGDGRCVTADSPIPNDAYCPTLTVSGFGTKRDCCCPVRRRSTRESTSVAENDEGSIEIPSLLHDQVGSARSDRYVREPIADYYRSNARAFSERKSFSAPLTDEETLSGQRTKPRSC